MTKAFVVLFSNFQIGENSYSPQRVYTDFKFPSNSFTVHNKYISEISECFGFKPDTIGNRLVIDIESLKSARKWIDDSNCKNDFPFIPGFKLYEGKNIKIGDSVYFHLPPLKISKNDTINSVDSSALMQNTWVLPINNSKRYVIANYLNGKKYGYVAEYYKNGNIKYETILKDENVNTFLFRAFNRKGELNYYYTQKGEKFCKIFTSKIKRKEDCFEFEKSAQ